MNDLQPSEMILPDRWKSVVTLWVTTANLKSVCEKLEQLKGKPINYATAKRFLNIPGIRKEIHRQIQSLGYDKIEMETDLVKDIKRDRIQCKDCLGLGWDRNDLENRKKCEPCKGSGFVPFKLDDGQRESIKVLAKVRGYLQESVGPAGLVGTINILQANGKP